MSTPILPLPMTGPDHEPPVRSDFPLVLVVDNVPGPCGGCRSISRATGYPGLMAVDRPNCHSLLRLPGCERIRRTRRGSGPLDARGREPRWPVSPVAVWAGRPADR